MKIVPWKVYDDMTRKIKIHRGMSGNWFVKIDDKLIAGFMDKDDAQIFVEVRFPNAKIIEDGNNK